jgi:hypothetical protein
LVVSPRMSVANDVRRSASQPRSQHRNDQPDQVQAPHREHPSAKTTRRLRTSHVTIALRHLRRCVCRSAISRYTRVDAAFELREPHRQPVAAGLLDRAWRPRYVAAMLRPRSWIEPAGESPARVGTGAPGSRPRSRGEIRGAERGVKSLHLGGSKRAGCVLQPRQMNNRGAEPVMSRRRPRLSGPVPGSAWRVPAGYGELHARTVRFGSGEIRLPGLRRAKTVAISRW